MVVSKSGGSMVGHPGIKEAALSNSSQSKRVGELPSLRYGTINTSKATGPLRFTSHYHNETLPKRSSTNAASTTRTRKFHNDEFSHYGGGNEDFKPIRPPRRVRFNLPSADGDAGVGAAPKSTPTTAAGHVWIRTRASDSTITQHSPVAHQSVHNNRRNHRVRDINFNNGTSVPVTASPGVRSRIHPTARYIKGTLSPTANATPHAAASPGGQALLRAARDGDDHLLMDLLRRAALLGLSEADLNAVDSCGRTILSYIASNGSIELLEQILQLPGLNPNKPDNEGNTPLHFASQAGQIECLNCMLSRCRGIEIDARNNLGFTALMKAALQGRNKCAKILLFAGANPTLRDNGRGFRADQWARFCGRYICADVIEKHARQRLLERSTSYGNWGGENEQNARVLMGKVVPVPPIPQQTSHHGLKSKLRKVFRTSSGPNQTNDNYSSARLVTQLTSAALCASSPVLPTGPSVPPVVKSLIRPLTVPRLQITLVNNNSDYPNNNFTSNNEMGKGGKNFDEHVAVKPARTKKKK